MKKIRNFSILLSLCLIAFLFTTTSCKSDEPLSTADANKEIDVSFSVSNVTSSTNSGASNVKGMQKANQSDGGDITCSDKLASYVKYKIDGSDFRVVNVFYDGGVPYTNAIKLAVGTHTLSEFLVYNDNNTPNDVSDDILLSATPHTGSAYASYVTAPLNQTITVTVDKKNQFKLEVICYTPKTFDSFGFVYYTFTQIQLKQLWFFADFCIKNKADYDGSLYTGQTNWTSGTGSFIDAPAIMKIEVWRNGALQNTFSNSYQGEKLGVNYVDYVGQTDNYELKLFILVRQGTAFNYVYFKSWTFTDTSTIPEGTDGVIDGVLGNCYDTSNPPDFILAPWMNLPTTATYKITNTTSTLGGYVDATLSKISAGYDLANGVYASNCADPAVTINSGVDIDMDIYSSLYVDKLPVFARSTKWERINWLYNHLSWYPGYHWYDVQGFIWLYNGWNGTALSTVPAVTALSNKMKADADNYGVGYKVPPGGWASIIFIKAGTPITATSAPLQTVMIKVDP